MCLRNGKEARRLEGRVMAEELSGTGRFRHAVSSVSMSRTPGWCFPTTSPARRVAVGRGTTTANISHHSTSKSSDANIGVSLGKKLYSERTSGKRSTELKS